MLRAREHPEKAMLEEPGEQDLRLSFAGVDQAGNECDSWICQKKPFQRTPSIRQWHPLPLIQPRNFSLTVVGGVPYEYDIGQFEITAAQYCAFLNAVDSEGENPKQPWTKVSLWNEKNNPLVNHF